MQSDRLAQIEGAKNLRPNTRRQETTTPMRRPQPGEGEGSQADFRDSSLPRFCKAGRTEPEGEPGMRVDFARPLRMTDGGKCYPFERITLSALRCDYPAATPVNPGVIRANSNFG